VVSIVISIVGEGVCDGLGVRVASGVVVGYVIAVTSPEQAVTRPNPVMIIIIKIIIDFFMVYLPYGPGFAFLFPKLTTELYHCLSYKKIY